VIVGLNFAKKSLGSVLLNQKNLIFTIVDKGTSTNHASLVILFAK